jgi:RNA-binding protein
MLTSKQKAYLKKIGSLEKTVVQIGVKGITEQVIQSVEEALAARELIKVSIASPLANVRKQISEEIAMQTNSELIHMLGKTCLLFKINPQKPVFSADMTKQKQG